MLLFLFSLLFLLSIYFSFLFPLLVFCRLPDSGNGEMVNKVETSEWKGWQKNTGWSSTLFSDTLTHFRGNLNWGTENPAFLNRLPEGLYWPRMEKYQKTANQLASFPGTLQDESPRGIYMLDFLRACWTSSEFNSNRSVRKKINKLLFQLVSLPLFHTLASETL